MLIANVPACRRLRLSAPGDSVCALLLSRLPMRTAGGGLKSWTRILGLAAYIFENGEEGKIHE